MIYYQSEGMVFREISPPTPIDDRADKYLSQFVWLQKIATLEVSYCDRSELTATVDGKPKFVAIAESQVIRLLNLKVGKTLILLKLIVAKYR